MEGKYVALVTLAALLGGYAYAYYQVKSGTCAASFGSDVTTYLAKGCPNNSFIDVVEYYNRLGAYSNIPK